MSISPWYKTATPTAPIWTVSLVPDSGSFSIANLSSINFSMLFKNLDTGMETTGVGVFSNLTATSTNSFGVAVPASIQYQVDASEVVLGRFQPVVLVTLSNGIQPFFFDDVWEVVSL